MSLLKDALGKKVPRSKYGSDSNDTEVQSNACSVPSPDYLYYSNGTHEISEMEISNLHCCLGLTTMTANEEPTTAVTLNTTSLEASSLQVEHLKGNPRSDGVSGSQDHDARAGQIHDSTHNPRIARTISQTVDIQGTEQKKKKSLKKRLKKAISKVLFLSKIRICKQTP